MARKMGKTADDQYMGGSKNTQKGTNYNKPKPKPKAAAKTAPKPRPKPAQAKKASPPKPRAKPAQAKKAAPKSGQPRNITPETSAKPNRSAKGNRIDAGLTKRSVSKKTAKPAAKKATRKRGVGKAGPASTSLRKRNYSKRG